MLILPRNTPDIPTSLHQVISLGSLLKIDHLLTLSVFLQYFTAFYSILQHFFGKPWGINGDSENIHTKDTIPTQKPLLAITSVGIPIWT